MFLRSLLGTSALAAAPKVVYAFAPPGGWVLGRRVYSFKNVAGVLGPNTFTRMISEPDDQLRYRVRRYLSLDEVERDFGPITFLKAHLETMDPRVVQVLRTKRGIQTRAVVQPAHRHRS